MKNRREVTKVVSREVFKGWINPTPEIVNFDNKALRAQTDLVNRIVDALDEI